LALRIRQRIGTHPVQIRLNPRKIRKRRTRARQILFGLLAVVVAVVVFFVCNGDEALRAASRLQPKARYGRETPWAMHKVAAPQLGVPSSLTATDVLGNGGPDLLITYPKRGRLFMAFYPQNQTDTWLHTTIAVPKINDVATWDVTGNGLPDILCATGTGVTLLENPGLIPARRGEWPASVFPKSTGNWTHIQSVGLLAATDFLLVGTQSPEQMTAAVTPAQGSAESTQGSAESAPNAAELSSASTSPASASPKPAKKPETLVFARLAPPADANKAKDLRNWTLETLAGGIEGTLLDVRGYDLNRDGRQDVAALIQTATGCSLLWLQNRGTEPWRAQWLWNLKGVARLPRHMLFLDGEEGYTLLLHAERALYRLQPSTWAPLTLDMTIVAKERGAQGKPGPLVPIDIRQEGHLMLAGGLSAGRWGMSPQRMAVFTFSPDEPDIPNFGQLAAPIKWGDGTGPLLDGKGESWKFLAVDDFNGDGYDDLAALCVGYTRLRPVLELVWFENPIASVVP